VPESDRWPKQSEMRSSLPPADRCSGIPGWGHSSKKVQTRRPAEVDRPDFSFARFHPKR
jgi:hypothetical protein